ncbi:hypothetical protein [Nocardia vulneris]|uniref:hypothetical protein n=1 Tax=Nocardia vulneris TaxID=1141657 RepID=UPI0012E023A0|nr:hypothetical protein [Nocardia vulneris]
MKLEFLGPNGRVLHARTVEDNEVMDTVKKVLQQAASGELPRALLDEYGELTVRSSDPEKLTRIMADSYFDFDPESEGGQILRDSNPYRRPNTN